MNREALLDKGERVFVFTVALVLGAEVVFTVMANGQHFAWPRLILGTFGAVFILYLAQRLYSGDRSVETLALGWAGFNIALMVASLALGPTQRSGFLGFVQDLGLPGRVMATLKLVAYLLFAGGILARGSVRAFLAHQRGEDVMRFVPVAETHTGAPVTWTADQTKVFGSLVNLMLATAAVLVLVGLFIILNAIPPSLNISQRGAVAILEGVLLIVLGGLLVVPARALAGAGAEPASTTDRVQGALERLAWWHLAAGGAGALLVAAVALRFFLDWTT